MVDILTYISRDKPNAAVEWIEKIEFKCLLIASQPGMGERRSSLGRDVRASTVGRYVIFHRWVNETAEILRVIPGDRNITTL